jgi:hypothetical protein
MLSVGINVDGTGHLMTSMSNITANSSIVSDAIGVDWVNSSATFQDTGSTIVGGIAFGGNGTSISSQAILLGTNLINGVPLNPTTATYVGGAPFTPGCSPTILVWDIYGSVSLVAGSNESMLPGVFSSAPIINTGYLFPQAAILVNLYAAVTSPVAVTTSFALSKITFPSILGVAAATIAASTTSGFQTTGGQLFPALTMLRILIGVPTNTTIAYPMVSGVLY